MPLAEWIALAVATAVAGIVRGFAGFGAGMVMAPAFSLLVGPARAVPTLILLEIAVGLRLIPEALPAIRWRSLLVLVVPASLAVPLGSRLLAVSDPDRIRVAISLLVLTFVVFMAFGWRRRSGAPPLVGGTAGALSGFLTGMCGVGGPPVILLLMSGPDSSERNRAMLIGFFGVTQIVAIPALALNGLVTSTVLWNALVLTPVFIGAAHLGSILFRRADEKLTRRLMLVVLAAVALAGLLAR